MKNIDVLRIDKQNEKDIMIKFLLAALFVLLMGSALYLLFWHVFGLYSLEVLLVIIATVTLALFFIIMCIEPLVNIIRVNRGQRSNYEIGVK